MTVIRRTAQLGPRQLAKRKHRPGRRFASSSHGEHDTAATSESFGIRFYATLAAVPATYFLYQATKSENGDSPLTRLISAYTEQQKTNEERNSRRTKMMERAAYDRNLFQSEGSRSTRRIDMKFPEFFNVGSPYNVPAGHGRANLDELVAHYEKERRESEERNAKKREQREGS